MEMIDGRKRETIKKQSSILTATGYIAKISIIS
jgi:hypothetical protein